MERGMKFQRIRGGKERWEAPWDMREGEKDGKDM